jgi:transposase InsO family protein
MLENGEIEALLNKLDIPEEGGRIIREIRASGPTRSVASSRIAGNVSGAFPSKKMGWSIQFESHSVEYRGILAEYEYGPDCLEYWDQPYKIEGLVYPGKNQRKVRSNPHPDFLVITPQGIYFDEWKKEQNLLSLRNNGGSRFIQDEDGSWHFPAAEKWAQERGFIYRVRLDTELNHFYVQNVDHIREYLNPKALPPPSDTLLRIEEILQANPWVSLKRLLDSGIDADHFIYLIAHGKLIADFENQLLHDVENAYVYRSIDDREAHRNCRSEECAVASVLPGVVRIEEGTALVWDGKPWVVANLGDTSVYLRSDSNTSTSLENEHFQRLIASGTILTAESQSLQNIDPGSLISEHLQRPPEAFREALRRAEILRKIEEKIPLEANEVRSIRTFRRWRRSAEEARISTGWSLPGLLPDVIFRGNRGSRVGQDHEVLAAKSLEAIETADRKSYQYAYQLYALSCKDKGEIPMSEKSFMKRLKQKPLDEFVESREGHKVAYQVGGFVPAFERDPFRHGVHPWDVCHIDHTQVPLFLQSASGQEWREKPWLTLIISAQSRRILGFYLAFHPPGTISCMMALREVIRRFGRLPKMVVVDGGKDFRSTDFEVFLARCESGRKRRPPHQPRFGTMIEAAFGGTIKQLFHNLEGNSQATRERTMTKETDPRNRVQFTLTDLYILLRKYFYETYDQSPHSGIGCSPKEAFENGLKIGGTREHISIPLTQELLFLSSPTVKGGTRKVIYRKGIEVSGFDYYSFELDGHGIPGSKVDVKYDPDNAGHVFAFVKKRWVECRSEHYQVFQRYTVFEVKIASEALREQERMKQCSRGKRLRNLVRYLESDEFKEQIRIRREKMMETVLSTPEIRLENVDLQKNDPEKASSIKTSDEKKMEDKPESFKRVTHGRYLSK